MYLAQTTKNRIKTMCKEKGVNMETLLTECELGVNAIRQINDTKGMASFSLARIADYLDCSVDYLLGRTTNPSSHKRTIIVGGKTMSFAKRLREAMRIRGKDLTPSERMGASYLAEKIYGKEDDDHIAHTLHISYLIDAHPNTIPTSAEIRVLAEILNVAVDQLTGTEEITDQNIRPYNSRYAAAQSYKNHPDGHEQKTKDKWQKIDNSPTTDDAFE